MLIKSSQTLYRVPKIFLLNINLCFTFKLTPIMFFFQIFRYKINIPKQTFFWANYSKRQIDVNEI